MLATGTPADFAKVVKYLGYTFRGQKLDDNHVEYLYQWLCAKSNMVMKNVSKCNEVVKSMLNQSFLVYFYCLSATMAKVTTMNKLHVCYNK